MAQTSVIVVSLAMLGTLSGLAYVHANRDESRSVAAASPTVHAAVGPTTSPVEPSSAPEVSEPVQPARQVATNDVPRWISDTQSNDAKTRAAAIEALANAPKSQALPALKRVLESGEPQIDRQIALQSLHKLALSDGDNTGQIRDTIRHAMYHSDDEAVTQSAQAFLEDIEVALAEQSASP